MLYCFLNSDNKEQKYSTLFEALTKCYTPLGKSPLWNMAINMSIGEHLWKIFFINWFVFCFGFNFNSSICLGGRRKHCFDLDNTILLHVFSA